MTLSTRRAPRDSKTGRRLVALLLVPVLGGALASCAGAGRARRADAPPTSVPFEFPRHQILVQARIAGQGPFSCTVDTGADPSVVDVALARLLGLPLSAAAGSAEGVGSDEVRAYSTRIEVAVSDAPSSGIDAVAIDLAPLSAAFGRPLHCVLGQSWLSTRWVRIDYPSRRLSYGSGAPRLPADRDCATFEMRFWLPDDLMPLVVARVDGVELPVSLDTGSSGSLKLFPEGARRAGLASDDSGAEGTVTGARGEATVRKITIPSLTLGPLLATDVAGSLGEKNEGEPDGREGNLGNAFLGRGVLALDYPGLRLWICAPPAN